jgi:hypothetical protein
MISYLLYILALGFLVAAVKYRGSGQHIHGTSPVRSGLALFAVFFVVVGFLSGKTQKLDQQHASEMSKHIRDYPGSILVSGLVRKVDGDLTWMFNTTDSSVQVLAFYRENATKDGWRIAKEEPPVLLSLEKGQQRLMIATTGGPGKTTITFVLHEITESP